MPVTLESRATLLRKAAVNVSLSEMKLPGSSCVCAESGTALVGQAQWRYRAANYSVTLFQTA